MRCLNAHGLKPNRNIGDESPRRPFAVGPVARRRRPRPARRPISARAPAATPHMGAWPPAPARGLGFGGWHWQQTWPIHVGPFAGPGPHRPVVSGRAMRRWASGAGLAGRSSWPSGNATEDAPGHRRGLAARELRLSTADRRSVGLAACVPMWPAALRMQGAHARVQPRGRVGPSRRCFT
jgi:hypothetical protein